MCLKDLLILSSYFKFSVSFIVFYHLSTKLLHKEISPVISILYIVYCELLQFNVLHSIRNIYLETFLKGRLLFSTIYVIPLEVAVAVESLIHCNLTQRAP